MSNFSLKASIYYIQSSDNYCEVHSKDEKFLLRTTISNMIEKLLPKNEFIRIHRQFIVKVALIDTVNLESNNLSVNKIKLPISKTYKKELLKIINTKN